jgi:hypothetical protein
MCTWKRAVAFLWIALAAHGTALAAEPAYSLECLAQMSRGELEALYHGAGPGSPPCGYLRGKAIYCSDEFLAGLRSGAVGCLWRGKRFEPDDTLVNQWLAFRAIRARVYEGPSWFDSQPAIIMDYCGTSRVWSDVRDEIREVSPGVYLGLMYRRRCPEPRFKMFFALEAVPKACH